MTIRSAQLVLAITILSETVLPAQTFGVIRSRPLPSPQEIADLETRVLQNPEELEARVELLRVYLDIAPAPAFDNPARRSVRLQHILYLVEHHPEAPSSASKAAYAYRSNGPYASAADHEAVRDRWLAAVQAHQTEKEVVMNAVKFLNVEDTEDAESALRRAMDADPENREFAANLGFQYATEILGNAPEISAHATAELERSSNAIVLAAAGTALPNLAVHGSGGRPVDPKIFELASELAARARELAPGDADVQGPMPLIKYFSAFSAVEPAVKPPTRIRVGETVQAANLIRKTPPQTPADTQLTGQVRFTAIIGRDGTIQDLQLVNGHPLLVQAARDAVQTWLYKPTQLNGTPVEVVTTITVSFPAN